LRMGNGEYFTIRSFMVCTIHLIYLGGLNLILRFAECKKRGGVLKNLTDKPTRKRSPGRSRHK
jgi:hypothetical protein